MRVEEKEEVNPRNQLDEEIASMVSYRHTGWHTQPMKRPGPCVQFPLNHKGLLFCLTLQNYNLYKASTHFDSAHKHLLFIKHRGYLLRQTTRKTYTHDQIDH